MSRLINIPRYSIVQKIEFGFFSLFSYKIHILKGINLPFSYSLIPFEALIL